MACLCPFAPTAYSIWMPPPRLERTYIGRECTGMTLPRRLVQWTMHFHSRQASRRRLATGSFASSQVILYPLARGLRYLDGTTRPRSTRSSEEKKVESWGDAAVNADIDAPAPSSTSAIASTNVHLRAVSIFYAGSGACDCLTQGDERLIVIGPSPLAAPVITQPSASHIPGN